MFRCNICPTGKLNCFVSRAPAESHVMEKHSSFGWKCTYCSYVTARQNGKHGICSKGKRPLLSECCNRCTGETGENARRAYFEYKNNDAKSKIQVVVEQVSRCMPRSPVRIVNNTSRSVTTPVNPAAPTFVRPAIIYVCIN